MAEVAEIDTGLAALLRGDLVAAQPLLAMEGAQPEEISARIDFHGIGHLLTSERAPGTALPEWLASHLRDAAMGCEFWEANHLRAITPLLAAMQVAGIAPVVMKGTALAYSLYRQPAARMRGDTDLLVRPADLRAARHALRDCGFFRAEELHGRLAQEVWLKRVGAEALHEIDLHWQVNDSPVLQQVLPLDEALANSRALERLAPGARAVSLAETYIQLSLNAQWHETFGYRIGNRKIAGTRRLIWTCDTDLLLRAMTDGDFELLLRRARETGVAPALQAAAVDARDRLHTPVRQELLDELDKAPRQSQVMDYLRCDNRIDRLKADFGASRGIGGKAAFAARMLLPTGRQLRQRYPAADKWPLPALYLRHAAENAAKLLRR